MEGLEGRVVGLAADDFVDGLAADCVCRHHAEIAQQAHRAMDRRLIDRGIGLANPRQNRRHRRVPATVAHRVEDLRFHDRRGRSHRVDIALEELAETAAAGIFRAPDRRDLVALEGQC